ncbi:MAG: DUF1800 domain-containing protein [Dehalococcoidia bacterium]
MVTEPKTDLGLIAHLMRRAGFGATRKELEEYTSKSYEEIVEDLVNPERFPEPDDEILGRYYPHLAANKDNPPIWNGRWFYRMINTRRPLEEKMTLFWHGVFATGWTKSEHTPTMVDHIQLLRSNCLSNFRTLLIELSKDPAMIYWLDNCENHGDSINENYGREILELFSMGIGNYSEEDIKNAARAFTGWTFKQPLPLYPFGHYGSAFEFRPEDHDDGEKTFLGHTGNFNGEDIVEIIVQQDATARFVSRHLYNFFVADEPQVPAWSITPPQDEAAIQALMDSFRESGGDIRTVMRTLFNSDFFKRANFRHVTSPAEFVAGTLKLAGAFTEVQPGLTGLEATMIAMGQKLMDPPSVEGWHTGKEWIDGGTLTERVNFAVDMMSDPARPGVRLIIDRIRGSGSPVGANEFVDGVLDLMGPVQVSDVTHQSLVDFAEEEGDLTFGTPGEVQRSEQRIVRMLQLIVASREFQFA